MTIFAKKCVHCISVCICESQGDEGNQKLLSTLDSIRIDVSNDKLPEAVIKLYDLPDSSLLKSDNIINNIGLISKKLAKYEKELIEECLDPDTLNRRHNKIALDILRIVTLIKRTCRN